MSKLKQILFLFTFCSMVLLSREFGRNNDGENWPTLSWGTSTPDAQRMHPDWVDKECL